MTPVTVRIEISQLEHLLLIEVNFRNSTRDFPRDERLAPSWTFMIEENSIAGEHAIRLTVVLHNPETVQFGDACISRALLLHFDKYKIP